MSTRVDYDAIASEYDTGRYRSKSFDPVLREFLDTRFRSRPVNVLDVACGTGAQLAANRRERPELRCVGVDRSLGMLRIARAREPEIRWLQADAAVLPFPSGSFDYLCGTLSP